MASSAELVMFSRFSLAGHEPGAFDVIHDKIVGFCPGAELMAIPLEVAGRILISQHTTVDFRITRVDPPKKVLSFADRIYQKSVNSEVM